MSSGRLWDVQRLDDLEAQVGGLGSPSASPVPSSRLLTTGDGLLIAGGTSADLSADRQHTLDFSVVGRIAFAAAEPDPATVALWFDTATGRIWIVKPDRSGFAFLLATS